MDRIDIHIEVPAVPFEELSNGSKGTDSETMRVQVNQAREIQAERFNKSVTRYNALMSSRDVRRHCALDRTCQNLLRHSVEEMGLSARAHDKILRVARTIADMEASEAITEPHLQEAVNYRTLDRDLWT
ncbi:Competence protein ComM [Roseimaritima multifibrata]|uniref:Competence protein ComM n=2 Tax=Roseimaritima multifibrata TaxID=1930274 RepID=A0A517MAI3_9BACT|nr:Competence protein ComM [Roseimaritima multifibrata]